MKKRYLLQKIAAHYNASPIHLQLRNTLQFDTLEQFDAFAAKLPMPQNTCWLLIDQENYTMPRASKACKNILEGYEQLFGYELFSVSDMLSDLCNEIKLLPSFSFAGPRGTIWDIHYETSCPGVSLPNIYEGLHVEAVAVQRDKAGEVVTTERIGELHVLDVRMPVQYLVLTTTDDITGRQYNFVKAPKAAKHYAAAMQVTEEPNMALMQRFAQDLVPVLERMTKLDPRLILQEKPITLSANHPLIDSHLERLLDKIDALKSGPDYNAETGMMVFSQDLLKTTAAEALKENPLDDVIKAQVKIYRTGISEYQVDVEASVALLATQGINNCYDLLALLLERYNAGNNRYCLSYHGPENHSVSVEDGASGRREYLLCDIPCFLDIEGALEAAGYPYWVLRGSTKDNKRITLESKVITAAKDAAATVAGADDWIKAEVRKVLPELVPESFVLANGTVKLDFSYAPSGDEKTIMLQAGLSGTTPEGVQALMGRHSTQLSINAALTPAKERWCSVDRSNTIFQRSFDTAELRRSVLRWCDVELYKSWVAEHPDEESMFLDDVIIKRLETAENKLEGIYTAVMNQHQPLVGSFISEMSKVANGSVERCSIVLSEEPYDNFLKAEVRRQAAQFGSGIELDVNTEGLREHIRLTAKSAAKDCGRSEDSCGLGANILAR